MSNKVKGEKQQPQQELGQQQEFPACSFFHDEFVRCIKPTQQFSHIYSYGCVEDCGKFVHDWRKCIVATNLKPGGQRDEALIKETHWYKHSQDPVVNNVFEYKDKPSWHVD
mmetsp:Transcript_3420/g.5329  ORF Transcript_3420/g.5329 Transcript_3420/m.5329 type:complete len:111 (+) Transcript_3420:195-527(+)